MSYPIRTTSEFLSVLKKNNQLWIIDKPVDPYLELAKVHREVCKRKGPALLFTNVKGSSFPVATNLYGAADRILLAFSEKRMQAIPQLAHLALHLQEQKKPSVISLLKEAKQFLHVGRKRITKGFNYTALSGDAIAKLPQIHAWKDDGGAFITLPLVYTKSLLNQAENLGMYRIQLFGKNQVGIHMQIQRGGNLHYYEAENQNQPLPARIFIGGAPALTLATIAPLPQNIPEWLLASFLMGEKIPYFQKNKQELPIFANTDFIITGELPPKERKVEGPFGDHYGYYSLAHLYPFMNVESVLHKKNAIYPATVVGKPIQEDHYITEFLQDMLSPLYPLVMPHVKSIWAFEESGVHTLAGAVVQNTYPREALTAALRILGEGQLSLTKVLFVTDQPIAIKNFTLLLETLLARANWETDLFLLTHASQDTLDYNGKKLNHGGKAIFMGIGDPKYTLATHWQGSFYNTNFGDAYVFCKGVLCVSAKVKYDLSPNLAEKLVLEEDIQAFRLVILCDDAKETIKNKNAFLWNVFTNFDPALDLYGKQKQAGLHIGITGTLIIDSRRKTWYAPPLIEDEATEKKVNEEWLPLIEKACRTMGTK